MNKSKSLLAAIAFVAATTASQAITFNTANGGGTYGGIFPGAPVGHVFEVTGGGISVDALAFISPNAGSLGGTATVGIYSYVGTPSTGSFGTLLGSVTITSSSAHVADYRWENLGSALNLSAGYYGILATAVTGALPVGEGTPFGADPTPTFNTGNNVSWTDDISGGSLAAPIHQSNSRWTVVNFDFQPVPEPETYAMIAGVGLVAFGLWRRRQ